MALNKSENMEKVRPAIDRWALCIALFVAIMMCTGGISSVEPPMIYVHLVLALALIAAALVRLFQQGFSNRLAQAASWIAVAIYLLVLLQLVPLPPSLWTHLPGRELVLRNLGLLDEKAPWMPLTLSPEATRQCALALMPPIAVFFATLTLSARNCMPIVIAILLCTLPSVSLALLQHLRGADGSYYIYESSYGIGTGVFNNRNFFAAQIYTALPFLGFALATMTRRFHLPLLLVGFLGLTFLIFLLSGLAVSESRTGIALSMLALGFAAIVARGGFVASRSGLWMLGASAMIVGLMIVAQASMMGIMRFAEPELAMDIRSEIWSTSIALLKEHFMLGSGLGSFPSLYQMVESPAVLQDTYVNHVHNDWFELAIETGAPGIVLELAFLAWYATSFWRIWRFGSSGGAANIQRTASLVLPLLMLHSLDDFAMRTPALITLLGLCCGLMCLSPVARSIADQQTTKPKGPKHATTPTKPFLRPERGFRPQSAQNLQLVGGLDKIASQLQNYLIFGRETV